MDIVERVKHWWRRPEESGQGLGMAPSRAVRRVYRKVSAYVASRLKDGASLQTRIILVTPNGKLPLSDTFLTVREAEEMRAALRERGVTCDICLAVCTNLRGKSRVKIHDFGGGD